MKSLLIISDTPFYRSDTQTSVFEPTLREIEEIADLFDSIAWISYQRGELVPHNARVSKRQNIKLISMPDYRGGVGFLNKLKVLLSLPVQWIFILRHLRKYTVVHTRGPSVPALLVLLSSFVLRKSIYWYKYAGNWSESNSPYSFRLQRWLLKRQMNKNFHISINGNWSGLHNGFLNWENPCLNDNEWYNASHGEKDFSKKWRICFVGNLDPFKGALRLVRALSSPGLSVKIEGVWVVGDGPEFSVLESLQGKLPFALHLMGYMPRSDIFAKIYSTSHFLVLPSESEGFPKVVAEAAAHRCIPVTSRVSAIDQYIVHGKNGFLLSDASEPSIIKTFADDIINLNSSHLNVIADAASALAKSFTYENFRERVNQVILNSENL